MFCKIIYKCFASVLQKIITVVKYFATLILKNKIMESNVFKNKLKVVLIILCLFSFAYNDNSYKESLLAEPVDITEDFESAETDYLINKYNTTENNIPQDLKIIKSANARYKVKNVEEATNKIKKIATKYGAYISDLRFQNDLYKKENRFTIKVPKNQFDKVMDSVNSVVDFVEYENITTKDVTEEYIDLEARLKTKLEVKQRYEVILRKNAKTVEDILKTENELRIIQEEIESAQGRLKYLTSKVAFSIIQIDLYESVDYVKKPKIYKKSFWNKTKEAFSNGWNFVEVLTIFLIRIWPVIIIGTFILFVLKRRFKK